MLFRKCERNHEITLFSSNKMDIEIFLVPNFKFRRVCLRMRFSSEIINIGSDIYEKKLQDKKQMAQFIILNDNSGSLIRKHGQWKR